jgi:hypothetical protein
MPARTQRNLQKLAEKQVVQLERQARDTVVHPTRIRIAGQIFDIELIDLSRRGFGARTKAIVPIGSRIEVELPLVGFMRAEVRWALCGYFGAAFLDRLEHHFPFVTAACRTSDARPAGPIQPLFEGRR